LTIDGGSLAADHLAAICQQIHQANCSRFQTEVISMPRGASPKRERQYKKIEQKLEKEGRYKGREEEVAARIVNKQRAKSGETKGNP
jgi:hypothetical protein